MEVANEAGPAGHDRGLHHRRMVAEVMGRSVGWIALHSGMAAGAHVICPSSLTIGEIVST